MILLFALAAASVTVSPLDLKLVCKGVVNETEDATAVQRRTNANGTFSQGAVVISRPVTREGSVEFELHGTNGTIYYDDGTKRDFKGAEVAPNKIVARYSRALGLSKPRIEIDRRTGQMQVMVQGSNYFRGTCDIAPEAPAQPKF
jgi:hypothetical protein